MDILYSSLHKHKQEFNSVGNEAEAIARKVDNISQISAALYWIKNIFFFSFGITFPYKPFFLPFIIFSSSHCCVLWKLFPRFVFLPSLQSQYEVGESKQQNKKSWIILTICYLFSFLPDERQRKYFIGFPGYFQQRNTFHCFPNLKGIQGNVILFIFTVNCDKRKIWWI